MSTPAVGETRLAPGGATWRVGALQGKNTVLTGPGPCRSVRIERTALVAEWGLADTAQPVTNAPSRQSGTWTLLTQERFRQHCADHGITELIKQLGVAEGTIRNWTYGTTAPGHETQTKLVELLAGRQPRSAKPIKPVKKAAVAPSKAAQARAVFLPANCLNAPQVKAAAEIMNAWAASQRLDGAAYTTVFCEVLRALA